MRFSRLVQLCQMCDTLKEAAAYLQQPSDDEELKNVMISNGKQMLQQIMLVLQQCPMDLKTNRSLEYLQELQVLWRLPMSQDMENHLTQLQAILREDVHYHVRALIIAESKWDPVATLYEAMVKDPRFDPVVVHIPVFREVEKSGEKKLEVYYRDYLNELGIPNIPWQEYDITTDLPELTFTNACYEATMDQRYWPAYLAKYSRLIYLPYVVYYNHPFGDQTLDIFCRTGAHIHSWREPQPSEAFAELFEKYSPRSEKMLMVTGIPKMDYVVRMREHGCPIPFHWEEKLEGRTVFLWNNTPTLELSNLRMLESMLPWFQEHKECALIWRPHPMTEIFLRCYYPEKEYQRLLQMIETVKTSDHMIYDMDTTNNYNYDYGPAFVKSHALISDISTLTTQYLFMDKPILLTDVSRFQQKLIPGKHIQNMEWMELARNTQEVQRFVEQIANGIDLKKELRTKALAEDFPLADGRASERICDVVWHDLHKEVFPDYIGGLPN